MRYAELRCKSNFSFLRGASHPHELIEEASRLGYAGLALTDLASISGTVRAHTTAKELGLPFLIGSEVQLDEGPTLVLWPINRQGYGRLCRLITRGRARTEKGEYQITWQDVCELNDDIMSGVVATNSQDLGSHEQFTRFLSGPFRDVFHDRGYLLCELHSGVDDHSVLDQMQSLAKQTNNRLVASGNVHYHEAKRMLVHDCITAIRNGTTIDCIHRERFSNSQHHLRSQEELKKVYKNCPEAIERTVEIVDRCNFSLDELRYEYPEEIAPTGMQQVEHLKRLTWEGAKKRWPAGVPNRVIELLKQEMQIIEELQYEAYFLTVWDLVRFAREQNILCQGRGSAANSAVCYCLGITNVDPSQSSVLFERFISRERNEAPDIDVDFEHQRREEVLQYLYAKYGRDRAGMTATVVSYRTKSAVREVGKSIGISSDTLDAITKLGSRDDSFDEQCRRGGLNPESELGRRFVFLVGTIKGFPRHLSQHVGGMVMTAGKLCELCPIENASMEGRTIIQWNKDDLDELGILKVDILSLGMLSALHRCLNLVKQHHHRALTLSTIPPDDQATYRMICLADTVGVFQIESRAQMNMLPRLRPKCFYDLVIEVAIVRPGPIQGNMVHPYLKARENPALVQYPNAAIKTVLEKTLGVPLFQEQAMRLAVVAAGFTPGEADQLRRAMAAWRRPGVIEKLRNKLLDGMKKTGLSESFAEHTFNQIRGFGEYGFPESHAASFALLVYASCYLKCHYPAAFCASLLNSQPMGFYAPAQLVADAKQHHVTIKPADVNYSDWDCTLEDLQSPDSDPNPAESEYSQPAVRLGMRTIAGLRREIANQIIDRRLKNGSFRNMNEFIQRTKFTKNTVAHLADADLFGSLNQNRRAAIWDSLAQEANPIEQPLLQQITDVENTPETLQPMSLQEEVLADYQTKGLSLRAHPISFIRNELTAEKCSKIEELATMRSGRHARVAGIVLVRQRPSTAKGITFVTIEDETGQSNLIFYAAVWKRFLRVAQTSHAWIIDGKVENSNGIVHVVVGRLSDLSEKIEMSNLNPRNFH